jgi:hypothetical protein
VQDALDLARTGLDEIGIRFHRPKKAIIFQTVRGVNCRGVSINAEECEVYVDYKDVKHRRVGRRMAELCVTGAHEFTHSTRSEYFPIESLVETAVSEGLAYTATEDFARLLLTDEEQRRCGAIIPELPKDRGAITALTYDLIEDDCCVVYPTPDFIQLKNEWFEDCADGQVLGIYAVRQLREDGATLAELMAMPAFEVLQANL